jgi:enamine deaminase RidA (YjgF/YER057c/UK114 family)
LSPAGVDKQVIKSNAPRPLAHYNEGFKIGDFVYAAGQIASDYKIGVPADAMRSPNFPFYNSDIKLQTRYILENLKKTFEAAGSSTTNHVHECTTVSGRMIVMVLRNRAGGVLGSPDAMEIASIRSLIGGQMT